MVDELDRSILDYLQKDGRIPAAQIAERIGLSRPAVAERIEKLEQEGVLRGTTAVISPEAMGQTVTAFVAARRPARLDKKTREQFRVLMERREILEVHSVAGEDCYLIKVRTDSIPSLNRILIDLNRAPLSMTTRTTIVMTTHVEKVGGIAAWGDLDET